MRMNTNKVSLELAKRLTYEFWGEHCSMLLRTQGLLKTISLLIVLG